MILVGRFKFSSCFSLGKAGLSLQVSGKKKKMENHMQNAKIARNQKLLLQPNP
jgi:hypothetical protein